LPTPQHVFSRGTTAALVTGGLAVLLVVLFGRLPGEGRWVSDLSNAGHGPAFALVTLVVFALLRESPARKITIFGEYSAAILISILLGALVELLQHFTGRDAQLIDLWTDTLGTLAVAGGLLAFDRRVPGTRQRIGSLVAVATCILMLAPLVVTATAYLKRHFGFPTLVDFSLPLATTFLHAGTSVTMERSELPRELRSDKRPSTGVRAHLTEKAGWILVLPEPVADWRGYTHLNLDLANPTDELLVLRLRVFDQTHGRSRHTGYRGSIAIAPHSRAMHNVALAALASGTGEAQVDTSRIGSVVIARARTNRAHEFYLMRIWLD
jgi:hypothetical protein